MPPSSDFEILEYDKKNYIVYLRDLDRGGKSITNDAEQVYQYIRNFYGGVLKTIFIQGGSKCQPLRSQSIGQ